MPKARLFRKIRSRIIDWRIERNTKLAVEMERKAAAFGAYSELEHQDVARGAKELAAIKRKRVENLIKKKKEKGL